MVGLVRVCFRQTVLQKMKIGEVKAWWKRQGYIMVALTKTPRMRTAKTHGVRFLNLPDECDGVLLYAAATYREQINMLSSEIIALLSI